LAEAGEFALRRSDVFAMDDTQTAAVVKHHFLDDKKVNVICVWQCTTPEMKAIDMLNLAEAWRRSGLETAVSVNRDGKRNGLYIASRKAWSNGILFSKYSLQVATLADYVDINTPEDLEEARRRLGA
jgi:CMP-N-acetylneuraminic acid synthetase